MAYESTSVPVERSQGEVRKLLNRHGVSRTIFEEARDELGQRWASVSFLHGTHAVRMRVPLKLVDEREVRGKAQRSRTKTADQIRDELYVQEERRIWRVIAWNLKRYSIFICPRDPSHTIGDNGDVLEATCSMCPPPDWGMARVEVVPVSEVDRLTQELDSTQLALAGEKHCHRRDNEYLLERAERAERALREIADRLHPIMLPDQIESLRLDALAALGSGPRENRGGLLPDPPSIAQGLTPPEEGPLAGPREDGSWRDDEEARRLMEAARPDQPREDGEPHGE